MDMKARKDGVTQGPGRVAVIYELADNLWTCRLLRLPWNYLDSVSAQLLSRRMGGLGALNSESVPWAIKIHM